MRAAQGLVRLEREIGAVCTSPLVRAEQTARILTEVLECTGGPEVVDALQPGEPRRKVLDLLRARDGSDTIVLVGHEPDLGKLAGLFLFGAPAPLPLKKAGVCVIQFVGPVREGLGRLTGFYSPRLLRRISDRKIKV